MNTLVTGGAGFIGSHIVERLLGEGHAVRVLDNFSTGKAENLPDHSRLEIVRGGVEDFATVERCVQGIDWIFHEAAIASVPKTIEDPLASQRENYGGTLNLLEAARRHGRPRLVFAASAAAYGDLPGLPKTETSPVRPLSPYAVDKLASEHACAVYHTLHGLHTVCLRYFNVFGPRQDPSSPYSGVISIFTDHLLGDTTPTILGDGEQTRDFVYVADVVDANLRAITTEAAAGGRFNIGTGRVTTLNQLLDTLYRLRGRNPDPRHGPVRPGDIRHSCADITLAEERLDWHPTVSLEEGLRHLLASLTAPRATG